MEDFIGFTFGDTHSSDLGIVRVSDGDRYEEQLLPDIKDINVSVPGLDGEYFFGSNFGPKEIDVNIAFDSLSESQLRKVRKVFGTKDVKELIFDELPYKKYLAKVKSPIEFSYVCFDEPFKTVGAQRDGVRVIDRVTNTSTEEIDGEEVEVTTTTLVREQITPYEIDHSRTQRVYKGDGKISFICYFPFAKSVYKVSPEEENDWAISSGILTATEYENVDKYNVESGVIQIYNAGDVDTGFRLYLPASALGSETTLIYKSSSTDVDEKSLLIKPITLKDTDIGVLVDTVNRLIIGVSLFTHNISGNAIYKTSGNIYNEYVDSGNFFLFKPNDRNDGATLEVVGGAEGVEIFYDYLYF